MTTALAARVRSEPGARGPMAAQPQDVVEPSDIAACTPLRSGGTRCVSEVATRRTS